MDSTSPILVTIPFCKPQELTEETQLLQHTKVEGFLNMINWEHIHITHSNIRPAKRQTILFNFNAPVINLYFSLEGNQQIYKTTNNKRVFTKNTCNLLYTPEKTLYQNHLYTKKTSNTVQITITVTYFKERIHMIYPILDVFKHYIEHKKFKWLNDENLSVTPEMHSILKEILACKQQGLLKTLFIEAKVIKLIMLLLEQFELLNIKLEEWLKPKDIENIRWVKKYIDENLSQYYTLIELAKKAGINDYKLKKGFKAMYGTTVFGYLNDIRMLEAKKLLLTHNTPISEISLSCGYQYVQNFTKAFKKKYGITPDKFRSSKL